jgi:putative membrane protein
VLLLAAVRSIGSSWISAASDQVLTAFSMRACCNSAVDDDGGREPDYRFSLANERTLLAWVRTALALDAAGLGVVRFAPVLLGALAAWSGYRRFVAAGRAIRAGAPLPAASAPRVLATTLAGLSLLIVALLLADRLG